MPARNVPNPGGKLGDFITRQTTRDVIKELDLRGFTEIETEAFFKKSKEALKNRFIDILATNPASGESLLINIGKKTKKGLPIKRERDALLDISTSPKIEDFPNSQLIFIEKGSKQFNLDIPTKLDFDPIIKF